MKFFWKSTSQFERTLLRLVATTFHDRMVTLRCFCHQFKLASVKPFMESLQQAAFISKQDQSNRFSDLIRSLILPIAFLEGSKKVFKFNTDKKLRPLKASKTIRMIIQVQQLLQLTKRSLELNECLPSQGLKKSY